MGLIYKKIMKTVANNRSSKLQRWFPLLLLVVILCCLFWRSFLPKYVHFSNDGPLGQQMTAWFELPAAFTGAWDDLNDIGASAGAFPMDINAAIKLSLGAVGYAKFLAPIALLILGLGAYAFFKQLKLSPLARILGALAAMLNSVFFSTACWGVASQQIAIGMDFCALAFVMSNNATTPALVRWARLALAGACVGLNVMEAADIGAIFSVFVAGFVFWKSLFEENTATITGGLRGIARVCLVAAFAGFIAWQSVSSLVTTQIQGVVSVGKNQETPAQHWDWATQWSLPKRETLGLFIPGVFGYKMDTPNNMPEFLQGIYQDGQYWGGMGRAPAVDRMLDSGQPVPSEYMGGMRQTGGQNYAGVLVTLVAVWVIGQSFRRKEKSALHSPHRQQAWFWAIVMAGSLLLAWGRFAPFYQLFYDLPYVSTMRNPTKFLIVYSWAISILFAYGIHALSSQSLVQSAAAPLPFLRQLKTWWSKAARFDRVWLWLMLAFLVLSAVGWQEYGSDSVRPKLIEYLQKVGVGDEKMAAMVADFSIGQVGWYVLMCTLVVILLLLVMMGVFNGSRAKVGGILLGVLLVLDLGAANLPFVTHWDYKQKYASNPIIDLLRNKPWEHRVALLPFRFPPEFQLLNELHAYEWNQHHFPYYNIQTINIIQRPRVASDIDAYESTLGKDPLRFWQLTNTRYFLGPAAFLQGMNEQLDPVGHRFSILQSFEIGPKPGISRAARYEELTAIPNTNGPYALFDFAGALPRAKLFSTWEVNTNNQANLDKLADSNFDPLQTVLVSTPSASFAKTATNQNSGTVDYNSYRTTDIKLTAKAEAPSILLLNDKYDSNWKVTVDGKPSELLCCNFIMRGVFIPPGTHAVEFTFSLPMRAFYISVIGLIVTAGLGGFVFLATRRKAEPV